jgi:hypothetical protein
MTLWPVPAENSSRFRLALVIIILFGIVGRLDHFTGPLSNFHLPRQIDTAAIARNFAEGRMNILYPQVDARGDTPGYVESEFHIYTFSVALLYRLFGVHEWLGRAVNLLVYALTALILFQLATRLFDEHVGLASVFFYSFAPLSWVMSHNFQPESLMVLGSVVAVYFFLDWTERERLPSLFLAAAGLSVAVLIKPFCLYLGLPLLYLATVKLDWAMFRRPVLWLFALAVVIPSALWYRHASHLWTAYGNTFGISGGWTNLAIPPLTSHLWLSLLKRLLQRTVFMITTPVGAPLLLLSLFLKSAKNRVLLWWGLGFLLFIVLAEERHRVHVYYQLPLVLLISIWMAYAARRIWDWNGLPRYVSRAAVVLVCAGFLLSGFRAEHRYTQASGPTATSRVFAEHVKRLTEPNAPIIFVHHTGPNYSDVFLEHRDVEGDLFPANPEDFYFSHRKGWLLMDFQASAERIHSLRGRGARYFASRVPELFTLHPGLREELDDLYTLVEVTPDWVIYRLDCHPDRPACRTPAGPATGGR